MTKPLLFGLERAALFHKGPIELSPRTQPEGRPSRDAALESISQAVDGATPRFVWAHQNANGDEIPCEIRLVRLGSDADPLVAGIITDLRDRERDRQEGERLRNQPELAHKMATMGLLASGVVHDLNNMLTPIVGFVELVKDDFPKGTWRREDLEEALKTFAKATELLRHLLSFTQGRMDDQPRADIARTVKESLELVRRTIPPNIKLREQIHADSGTVSAHTAQLLQVVLNLCMNACQAMADAGGMLKITLSPVEIEPVPAAELPKLPPGPYAKLTVSDTGTGIDAEVLGPGRRSAKRSCTRTGRTWLKSVVSPRRVSTYDSRPSASWPWSQPTTASCRPNLPLASCASRASGAKASGWGTG